MPGSDATVSRSGTGDATAQRDGGGPATTTAPAVRSLGGPMARRQLHVVYILYRSGSMNANGKIKALNVAMIERCCARRRWTT